MSLAVNSFLNATVPRFSSEVVRHMIEVDDCSLVGWLLFVEAEVVLRDDKARDVPFIVLV